MNTEDFFICISSLGSTKEPFKSTQLTYYIFEKIFPDLEPEAILSMCYTNKLIEDFLDKIYGINFDISIKTESSTWDTFIIEDFKTLYVPITLFFIAELTLFSRIFRCL